MPRARISGTGATPDPSFRFEPGQCITLTSCSASSCCSRSSTQTQCAAHRCGDARWTLARYSMFVRAAGRLLDDRDLVARFRRVGVHERVLLNPTGWRPLRAARASRTRRSAARTPRAGARWPRRASARGSRRSRRSTPRVLLQPLRHLRVEVHHALADRRAQPALRDRFEHHIGVVHRLHRQHRGRAAAQQLGRRQPRRGAQRLGRVRGFHRPDARPQPVHQREIVGVAAEQRLTEVNVRLDEAGQHVAAARLDDAIVTAGEVRPDRGDAAVADRDVALDDVEAVVHRKNDAAADEERTHLAADLCVSRRSDTRVRPDSLLERWRGPLHRGRLHLAVLHGDQLGEDADGDFLRRDGADVEADRRVHALQRLRRHLRRPTARRRCAPPWRGCRSGRDSAGRAARARAAPRGRWCGRA